MFLQMILLVSFSLFPHYYDFIRNIQLQTSNVSTQRLPGLVMVNRRGLGKGGNVR